MPRKANDVAQKREVVKIPRTKFEKEDIVVGINGTMYQIQRGVDVSVPEEVACALRMAAYSENYAIEAEETMRNNSQFNG